MIKSISKTKTFSNKILELYTRSYSDKVGRVFAKNDISPSYHIHI